MDLINKEYMETFIDRLKSNIEEVVLMRIAEATEPLNNKISTLEKKIRLYKAHMDLLEIKQDDAIQYSNISCLGCFASFFQVMTTKANMIIATSHGRYFPK